MGDWKDSQRLWGALWMIEKMSEGSGVLSFNSIL